MDPVAVTQYNVTMVEFLELMLLCINWTCGQTGRCIEMLSLLYRNKMSANRNILIEDGYVMIVADNYKSQAVIEDTKARQS